MTTALDNSHYFSYADITSPGIKESNDDCVGCQIPPHYLLAQKGAVFVIADGVSTAEAGREASHICVHELIREYYLTPVSWTVEQSARAVLQIINRQLYLRNGRFVDERRGFVTTLSLLIIHGNQAHIFNIGDSRIYRIRGSEVEQLTEDHSGEHENGDRYLTRAMGIETVLRVDYFNLEVDSADAFLLTTDGFHDYIRLQEYLNQLPDSLQEETLASWLSAGIEIALEKGSNDNLSGAFIALREPLPQQDSVVPKSAHTRRGLPPIAPDLPDGLVLDGYRIIRELYASSRSQVYLVEDVETKNSLAMVVPSSRFEEDIAYAEEFEKTEWIGKRVCHDNIVTVHQVQRPKSYLYEIIEYVYGINLEAWMLKYPNPTGGKVIKIAKQIIAALQLFHSKGIILRDLKPSNIMITPDEQVKITKWSSACILGVTTASGSGATSNNDFNEVTLFDHGEFYGTLKYSDPCYRLGSLPNEKGDQYSLASIIYEMLTGHTPYGNRLSRGDGAKELQLLTYDLSFKFNNKIPIWFDGTLKLALSAQPQERYPTLGKFAHDLENPNPQFLTEEYFKNLEKTLPSIDVWKSLALIWLGSMLLAFLVFLG